jgi:hypothetical protein
MRPLKSEINREIGQNKRRRGEPTFRLHLTHISTESHMLLFISCYFGNKTSM